MKEIMNYQKPSFGAYMLPVFLLVMGVFLLFGSAVSGMTIVGAIVAVFFLIVAFILGKGAVQDRQKLKQQLEELETTGVMEQFIAEFQTAKQMRQDHIRLGTRYIFRKHGGPLLQYTDVKQVYQHITRRNFVESSRSLKAVLNDTRVVDLCQLKLRGKSEDEMKQIIVYLCMKNPNILVGYKDPVRLVK